MTSYIEVSEKSNAIISYAETSKATEMLEKSGGKTERNSLRVQNSGSCTRPHSC